MKNGKKDIFDSNRRFIPLKDILSKDEMENCVWLARMLAVYDTFHVKKKNIKEVVYIFFSKKRRGSVEIFSYKTADGRKITQKELYQITKQMVLELIDSNAYCKLVKADWFPIIYCGK